MREHRPDPFEISVAVFFVAILPIWFAWLIIYSSSFWLLGVIGLIIYLWLVAGSHIVAVFKGLDEEPICKSAPKPTLQRRYQTWEGTEKRVKEIVKFSENLLAGHDLNTKQHIDFYENNKDDIDACLEWLSEKNSTPLCIVKNLQDKTAQTHKRTQLSSALEILTGRKDSRRSQAPPQSPLDSAANESATSPTNAIPEPTEAQKAAGNYTMGHPDPALTRGFDITIENPKGSYRRGVSPQGMPWQTELAHHYVKIHGKDGNTVKAFLGSNPNKGKVFIVDQQDPKTGKFDEHKVLMGFPDKKAAEDAYLANYEPKWKGLKAITELSDQQLRAFLHNRILRRPYSEAATDPRDKATINESEANKIAQKYLCSLIGLGLCKHPPANLFGFDPAKEFLFEISLFDQPQTGGDTRYLAVSKLTGKVNCLGSLGE